MKFLAYIIISSHLLLSTTAYADVDWVATSNAHAMPVLKLMAKYYPETAGSLGVDGYDEAILDLGPNRIERQAQDTRTPSPRYSDADRKARGRLKRIATSQGKTGFANSHPGLE